MKTHERKIEQLVAANTLLQPLGFRASGRAMYWPGQGIDMLEVVTEKGVPTGDLFNISPRGRYLGSNADGCIETKHGWPLVPMRSLAVTALSGAGVVAVDFDRSSVAISSVNPKHIIDDFIGFRVENANATDTPLTVLIQNLEIPQASTGGGYFGVGVVDFR